MRTTLLALLLAIALGAGSVWLLRADRSGDDGGATPEGGLREPAAAEPGPGPRVEPAPSLSGTGQPGGRPGTTRPAHPVVPTDQIRRGGLDVLVLMPDGTPWPPEEVQVRLERMPEPFWAPPVGLADEETRVWRFRKVPVGQVRVTVTGPHVATAEGLGRILPDEVASLRVHADRAGAIRYRARGLYDEVEVTKVALVLRDERTGRAVAATWQELSPAVTVPRHAAEVTQGPEGIITGLPPGPYRLVGTSEGGDEHEVPVDVVLGETATVELTFRR